MGMASASYRSASRRTHTLGVVDEVEVPIGMLGRPTVRRGHDEIAFDLEKSQWRTTDLTGCSAGGVEEDQMPGRRMVDGRPIALDVLTDMLGRMGP